MKKKLKLNELIENELTNQELSKLKGGGGCIWKCIDSNQYKRVYIKTHPEVQSAEINDDPVV